MREIIVDSFAGGGGASTGIELALGRSPDIAINHEAVALGMHEVNHPQTLHLQSDIWEVDPVEACAGRPVGLGWFSPDCKHFSKAKGGKPVEKKIRGLAWVVVHWANTVKPRVIILENVEEFQTWGPLGSDNKPCPVQKGVTFKRWVAELERLGYAVEWRELRACDFAAPTIRKRLFLIARRDGRPIVWPDQTHGDPKSDAVKQGRLKPWRTAAEIIDWSLPCPSIFDTAAEILAKHGRRAIRPLADASMARLAKGVRRYVIDAAEPFIVNLTHQGGDRVEAASEPLRTATAAHRGEKAVVGPFLAGVGGRMAQTEPRGLGNPSQTLTSKADSVLVAPFMVPRYGERDGQEPRTRSIKEPMATAVPTGNGSSLATVFISAAQQGGNNRTATDPLHTVTASDGDQNQVIAAFMAQNNYQEPGHAMSEGVSTVVGKGSTQSLAAAHIVRQFGTGIGHGADEPARTVMADGQGKTQVSAAFLQKYYGADQDPQLNEPLHTATVKDRFGLSSALLAAPPFGPEHYARARQVADLLRAHGLWDDREFVTVEIAGQTFVIVDIGLRMLTPRELFRAQGFPESYVIDRLPDGLPITGTDQVSKCGNSVCPPIAAALVKANYRPDEAAPAPEFMEAAE
ncbi:site-specific DNA methylase [Bradyrhizobium sp. YR681]|uniref:DNA cytosine methyltransferase n=1 Tax=Bradyrhizobium sp. YR681 TaxID=1144344 RepID=UPI0002712A3F|nr:DNA cytosine methyltransferase [Bradyrhizobium sp. YR681]EJN14719.1 site-specific DNA methylase [Bradyrhizobium sp. YR681]